MFFFSWLCKMVIDQKRCVFTISGLQGLRWLFFLGATAASPVNHNPFFAPAHIFVEAQLEPDPVDPGSVFFKADFSDAQLGGSSISLALFSNPRRRFYNRTTPKCDFLYKRQRLVQAKKHLRLYK